jgi:hypothetical protein
MSEVPDQEDELLLIGDDWAEDHHDVEVQDATGRKLAAARLPEGVGGGSRSCTSLSRSTAVRAWTPPGS